NCGRQQTEEDDRAREGHGNPPQASERDSDPRVLASAASHKGEIHVNARRRRTRMRNGLATQILPGRFRESELVARGAMGDVYRAVDVLLGRVVAVKVLSEAYTGDESAHQRFAREARAAASLAGDPNIVTVYDITEASGRPCLVMEFLGGGSLESVLRREGAPPPERALRWLEQAGRALDHAHEAGVVHRDVKPGNLLLDDLGVVHVADFGIASAAGAASLTESGTLIGTAGYL